MLALKTSSHPSNYFNEINRASTKDSKHVLTNKTKKKRIPNQLDSADEVSRVGSDAERALAEHNK